MLARWWSTGHRHLLINSSACGTPPRSRGPKRHCQTSHPDASSHACGSALRRASAQGIEISCVTLAMDPWRYMVINARFIGVQRVLPKRVLHSGAGKWFQSLVDVALEIVEAFSMKFHADPKDPHLGTISNHLKGDSNIFNATLNHI
jgi:hypothetical protein